MCAYHCAKLLYTTQHGTVLIIFPIHLQINLTALKQSTGEEMATAAVSCFCMLRQNMNKG